MVQVSIMPSPEFHELFDRLTFWLFAGFKDDDLRSYTDHAIRFRLNHGVCGALSKVEEDGFCRAGVGPVKRVIEILGRNVLVSDVNLDTVMLTLPGDRGVVHWVGRIVRFQNPTRDYIIFKLGTGLDVKEAGPP